jgi:hypothetical protein
VCSYHLDAPPDLDQTHVWIDRTDAVPRDASHVSGWDYDAASSQLTLYGAYCDELATGASTIDVTFGCALPPVIL